MSDQRMSDQMWTALGDEIEPVWAPERADGLFAQRSRVGRPDSGRWCGPRSAVASTALIAVGSLAIVKWRSVVPHAAPLVSARKHGPERAGSGRQHRDRHRDATVARYRARSTAGSRRARVHAARRRCAVLGSTRLPPSLRRDCRGRDHRGPGHDVHRPLSRRRSVEYRRRRGARPRARERHRHGGFGGRDPGGACLAGSPKSRGNRSGRPARWRHRGGRSQSVVNTKRRSGRYGKPVPVPCATTPPICCWPRTPLV